MPQGDAVYLSDDVRDGPLRERVCPLAGQRGAGSVMAEELRDMGLDLFRQRDSDKIDMQYLIGDRMMLFLPDHGIIMSPLLIPIDDVQRKNDFPVMLAADTLIGLAVDGNRQGFLSPAIRFSLRRAFTFCFFNTFRVLTSKRISSIIPP